MELTTTEPHLVGPEEGATAPARMLLLFSRPGFETFSTDFKPDPAVAQQVLERYDLEVLEPPAH